MTRIMGLTYAVHSPVGCIKIPKVTSPAPVSVDTEAWEFPWQWRNIVTSDVSMVSSSASN